MHAIGLANSAKMEGCESFLEGASFLFDAFTTLQGLKSSPTGQACAVHAPDRIRLLPILIPVLARSMLNPQHLMPHHATPYHAIPYLTSLYHTLPYFTIPFLTIPYLAACHNSTRHDTPRHNTTRHAHPTPCPGYICAVATG